MSNTLLSLVILLIASNVLASDKNIDGCFSHFKGQDFSKSIEFGKKAIKSSPKKFDSHFCLGISYKEISEYKSALAELKHAEKLATKQDEVAGVSSFIGGIYITLRNYDEGLKYSNKALAIRRDLEDSTGISQELNNIATIYTQTGQTEKALEYYQQSLDVEPNKSKKANTYGNIGVLYLVSRRAAEAEPYFIKALDIAENNGDYQGQATFLTRLGQAEYKQGKLDIAKEHLIKGRDMSRSVKAPEFEGMAIHFLGNVYFKLGDIETSIEHLNQAIAIFNKIGNSDSVKYVQQDIDFIKKQAAAK
ncbi:MAG: tetratricopeptide repeat protein [Desulfuromonadales bacterium]